MMVNGTQIAEVFGATQQSINQCHSHENLSLISYDNPLYIWNQQHNTTKPALYNHPNTPNKSIKQTPIKIQ